MTKLKFSEKLSMIFTAAFIVYFFITPLIEVTITNIWGVETEVTVSWHERKRFGKPGSIEQIGSYGYYYVDGKKYQALIVEDVPIGTKFKIKYSPICPDSYNIIEEIISE